MSHSLINVFEILTNLGHIFRVCSECVQSVFIESIYIQSCNTCYGNLDKSSCRAGAGGGEEGEGEGDEQQLEQSLDCRALHLQAGHDLGGVLPDGSFCNL